MEDKRIRNLSGFFMEAFGRKVFKVSLWGGFTCPNRDGTFSTDGCSFCNPLSTRPYTYSEGKSVSEQMRDGCRYISRRYGVNSFLPYFQDYSATYGDPLSLDAVYSKALEFPGAVGLSLCTRPDCLDKPVLDYLEGLSQKIFLWVELGVQTSDDRILKDMNRCHTSRCTEMAFGALHDRGIFTAAHMIIGYPGSTTDTVLRDAAFVRNAGANGIKLQNLHIVKNTELAERLANGEFEPISLDRYVEMAILFLEHSDPNAIIMRLSGKAPDHLTVAPEWSKDKIAAINGIRTGMVRRDTWQGKALGFEKSAVEKPLEKIPSHWRMV